MNIRVRFSKHGCLKFIGHLDVMRYFQKAMRRAEIDMCYSEGFSPHMIMSFASPLGLGLESDGEYMDISVKQSPSSKEAVESLNAVMAEGWKKKLEEFLALPEIRIMKETKKGEQEVDIRPWVYDYHIKDQTIFLKVSAGSVHNLKPELLLKAFGDWAGVEIPAFALLICRKEMYADEGSETERKLVALEELGEEIG